MHRLRILLAALAAFAAGAVTTSRLAAQNAGYVVIVNESNNLTGLSTDEVGRLFMKRTVRWTTGEAVVPVDLAENSPVRAAFSRDVHHKQTSEVKAYWQTVIFSGRGVPPMEARTESDVIAFVRANPGAVGYVSASTTLPQGVRAVRIHS